MLDINSLENVLMTLAFIFLSLYGIATLAETKPKWFMSKTFIKTKAMEEKYDKALESRKDMLVIDI